jgi:hypothetical protein
MITNIIISGKQALTIDIDWLHVEPIPGGIPGGKFAVDAGIVDPVAICDTKQEAVDFQKLIHTMLRLGVWGLKALNSVTSQIEMNLCFATDPVYTSGISEEQINAMRVGFKESLIEICLAYATMRSKDNDGLEDAHYALDEARKYFNSILEIKNAEPLKMFEEIKKFDARVAEIVSNFADSKVTVM